MRDSQDSTIPPFAPLYPSGNIAHFDEPDIMDSIILNDAEE